MKKLSVLFIIITSSFILLSCGSTNSKTNYQISISASPDAGGTVSPASGPYKEGTSLDISATPEEGWRFVRWAGDYQSTDRSATITVDADKRIKAIFAKKEHSLTVNTEGKGAVREKVIQSKSTDYKYGTTVQLTANPDKGWEFIKWEGDLSGSKNPATITVDKAKEVTAVFTKKSYALTIEKEGKGTIEEKVIQAKSVDYTHGTIVQLTANPATGWEFVKWKGAVTGHENPVKLTVDQSKAVTAVFEKKLYELAIETEGRGSVQEKVLKAKNYTYGTTVELTATPAQGWEFIKWKGAVTGHKNPVQLAVDQPKQVMAVFKKKSFKLTTRTEGKGHVSRSPDQARYDYGTNVTLSATPAKGWRFVQWQGNLTTNKNPVQLTMNQPREVTAVFEKKSYELTINIDGQGSVDERLIEGKAKNYKYGTMVALTATPAKGWKFVEWKGAITGRENPARVTVDQPREVTAVFVRKSFKLTTKTDGKGSVAKSPDRTNYNYGTKVTLTAAPAQGWRFIKWEGDLASTKNPAQITVDKAQQVVAIFKKVYTIDIAAKGNGEVQTKPDKTDYIEGSTIKLTAVPKKGWKFVRWEGGLTGSKNPRQLIVDSDKTIQAVFEKKQFSVSVSTKGNGVVDHSPDKKSYYYNNQVQFTATADKGSAFIRWEGALRGSKNPQMLTVTDNATVTAIFKTYEEALYSYFYANIIIGSRVHKASLQLTNHLPEPVLLKELVVRRKDGSIVNQSEVGQKITAGRTLGFSLSFGIPPVEQQFNKYTVEWICTYQGNEVTKVGVVTPHDWSRYKTSIDNIIELHVGP